MDVTEPARPTPTVEQTSDAPAAVPDTVLGWARRPGAAALLSAARPKAEAGDSGDLVRLAVPAEHRDDVGRMLGVRWELSGK